MVSQQARFCNGAVRCMSRVLLPLLFLPLLFAAAERADTSQAETHARQSYALSQQGRLPEAEQEMREAIRLAPRNPLYHSALGGLLAKDEKLSEA
jgi:Flp pilus assembly protein TadD